MQQPKISVVMSVHNGAEHLQESIDSIFHQTFSDFEFIVIDDASSDATAEILQAFITKDDRIRIITNEINLGLAASMNKGLRIAIGKYIARLDADDLSLPERLGIQYNYLENHPEYFLIGSGSIIIDKFGKEYAIHRFPSDEDTLRKNIIHKNQFRHPSIMFRNDKEHFYREKFYTAQDYDLILRLLSEGKRFINIPDLLVKYRTWRKSQLSQRSAQQLLFAIKAQEFYQERLLRGKDSYDDFNPATIMNINIDNTTDHNVLDLKIRVLLNESKLPETRSCINYYWKNYGYFNKYLLIWAGTFFGKSFINFLLRLRRKYRSERPYVLIYDMSKSEDLKSNIALFFTNGIGLEVWQRVGSLSREIALYRRLADKGLNITFFTYDLSKKVPELGFSAQIVTQWPFVLPNRFGLLYQILLPFIRYRSGRNISAIFTNQAHSGWPSIIAGYIWRAKVVARCGYVFGEWAETLKLTGRVIRRTIRNEKWTFAKADICIIPTQDLAQWVIQKYGIEESKIRVIPNYVTEDFLKSRPNCSQDIDLICVGRMAHEKRYNLILDAVSDLGIKVVFIGDGPMREATTEYAIFRKVNLEILPRLSNNKLPAYLFRSKVFLLASIREGHPKSLIEAMACGCACIGTDSPGIKNQIIHSETGLLVDPDSDSIRKGIVKLLKEETLRNRLGENARKYARENWSLDVITEKYVNILNELNTICNRNKIREGI